jgi:perosamine synthetase
MPFIDGLLEKHRSNASLYHECFESFKEVVPAGHKANDGSSFWVFTMLLKSDKITRDDLLKKLNDEGIAAGLVHVPNDTYTCFKDFVTDLPGVREFSSCQFSLPCGWWLNEEDIRFIAQRVREIISS